MGGHAGGDVASHIAVNHLVELDREFPTIAAATKALRARILEANTMIVDVVDTYPQLAGLGTTLSVVLRVGSKAVIAHIGDSRIYRQRSGELEQMTKDHTFVQRLIDTGQISIAEAAVHPRRSVLMRVLGDVDATPDLDVFTVDLQPGDVWLMCSDGLTGCLDDPEIEALTESHTSVRSLASALIARSLDEGAPDNVTVITAQVITAIDEPTATKPMLVGSASAENPLKTLPKVGELGLSGPRAKAASLPVHTGGIPVMEQDDPFANLAAPVEEPRRRSRGVWVVVVIALIIIGALVWLVVATNGGQASGIALDWVGAGFASSGGQQWEWHVA